MVKIIIFVEANQVQTLKKQFATSGYTGQYSTMTSLAEIL